MRLLLIRHAQTPANVRGELATARPGPGLTDLGLQQAAGVVQALSGERIDAVGYLIGVGAWSDRTADALEPLVRTPPQLVAAAVNTPEYLTS